MKKFAAFLAAVMLFAGCNVKNENSAAVPDTTTEAVSQSGDATTDASSENAGITSGDSSEIPIVTLAPETEQTGDTAQSPTDSTNSSQASTSSTKTTTAATSAPKTLVLTYTKGASWDDGGKTVTQFDFTLKNNTDKTVSSWNVSVDVPSGTEIVGGWSGKFAVNGTKLSVSNETYNGELPSGGETSFGIQLKCTGGVTIGGAAGSGTSGGNNGNNSNNGNSDNSGNSGSGEKPAAYTPSNKKAVQGDDWLSVKGNKIVDKNGKEVWLTGVNWFGYNTGTNTFDGLWATNLENSIQAIADHGFNLLRIPISAELVNNWTSGSYPKANYNNAENVNLLDKNSLEIMDYVVDLCQSVGIKIMYDIHSADTDAMGHMYAVWYSDKTSVDDFYSALEFLADRYKNNDTVIAYDLKNEPHGKPNESPRAIWNGSTDKNNWKYIAETAAAKVLAKNPNVLIMVEGIEAYPINIKTNNFTSTSSADYDFNWWGGNLRGVADYPVDLGKYQNKLVYSPHDYGPAVYKQPWFEGGFTYESLIKDCWLDNWLYIHTDGTAPLLIGEWGGFMDGGDNEKWMEYMRKLIKTYKLHHTFWCFNANSGDTGGLVIDDFKTWDSEKYEFVKEVLWQKDGKFVGLDHEIPLGTNGVALS